MDKGYKILIATDNQYLGRSIQTLLGVHHYDSSFAENCDQVLKSLSENQYQLVVFGPRFLEKLPPQRTEAIAHSVPPSTKILVLSFTNSIDEFEVHSLHEIIAFENVSVEPDALIRYVKEVLSPSASS